MGDSHNRASRLMKLTRKERGAVFTKQSLEQLGAEPLDDSCLYSDIKQSLKKHRIVFQQRNPLYCYKRYTIRKKIEIS